MEQRDKTETSIANRSYDFKPFDLDQPVRVYFTTMPHWRQEGCTYFVTYRLADSIPKQVLERWDIEKSEWLAARGAAVTDRDGWKDAFLKLNEKDRFAFEKHFNRQLNSYLDEGRGSCVLRDPRCAQIVVEGWDYFDGERYGLGDLVVMPNHVHLLVTPFAGHQLEDIMQSRKRQSAREINALLGGAGKLWQKHSFDHIVRNENALERFENYIEENPRNAGLAEGEYRYRVASNAESEVMK